MELEEWLDKLINKLTNVKRLEYFTPGRLFIVDTFEYQFSKLDLNTQIDVLYTVSKNIFWREAHKYSKYLDKHDKEEIILESIYEVLQKYDILECCSYKNLICKFIENKALKLIEQRTTQKRGGNVIHTSLNKEIPIIIPIIDNSYNTATMLIWLEQIKSKLTNNEYKYLKLIIEEPNILEMSNTEIAKELDVSEGTIRYIQKSLKTKLLNLFED